MAKRNYAFDDAVDHDDTDTEVTLDDKVKVTKNPEDADDEPETNPGSDFDDLHPHLFDDVPDPKDDDEDEDDEDLDETGEDEPDNKKGSLDDVDDEDEQEEDDSQKSPFRKRLARMERQLKEEREEKAKISNRLKAIELSTNQRTAEAELAGKKAKLTGEMETAEAELDALLEAGTDPKAIRVATRKLAGLEFDLKQAELDAERAKKINEEAPLDDMVVKKAERWRRAHPKFKTDPGFAGFTREIDKALQAEGYNPNDDDFWTELDSRVKERFPEEYRGSKKDDKGRRRPPTRDTGHSDRDAGKPRVRSGETFQRRGNKVIVSAQQKANMRRFGMDPDSAEDLKTYIRENLPRKKG